MASSVVKVVSVAAGAVGKALKSPATRKGAMFVFGGIVRKSGPQR